MATYDIDEARLTLAEGWEDRSLNRLVYVPEKDEEKGGTLTVLVNRQPTRGRPLGKILDEVVVSMGRRLAGFSLVSREEVTIEDQPAIVLSIKYSDEGKPYEQRSIWLLVGKKCATVGVLASPELAERAEKVFAEIRATIHRRPREEGMTPIDVAPEPRPPPSVS